MTCRSHRDAVMDLARGVPLPAAAARAAEAHAETCPACAAQLDRQRDLTGALAALAGDSADWTAPEGVEDRLMDAFALVHPSPVRRAPARRRDWWTAAAAAAAVVAAVSWLAMWQLYAPVAVPEIVAAPAPHLAAPILPKPAAVARMEFAAGPVPAPTMDRTTRPARSREQVRTLEFMPIPAAAALPPFESGSIVRIQLAVAALPAYGVAIVPDGGRSAVEADLLVGQDGQARAIRLVASGERAAVSRSRQ